MIFKAIKKFWINLFKRKKYKNVLILEKNDFKPVKNDSIVLIKKNDKFEWAKFNCPCNCGKEIFVSLNPAIKPSWSIKLDKVDNKNLVTLSPSVHLTGFACKSHFFIRKNKIEWV